MRPKFLVWVILSAVFSAPSSAAADPLTVTSGYVVFTDEPGDFVFTGAGFDLRGSWFPRSVSGMHWYDVCQPCAPGTSLTFGATYDFSTDLATVAAGSVNGVDYSRLYYDASLTFRGPTVVAPAFNPGGHTLASGRFDFTGQIGVFADDSRSGVPLFLADLLGSGTAYVYFGAHPEGLEVHDIDYVFDDAAPTPEPATLALLCAGLAAAAWRRHAPRRRGSCDQR